MLSVRFERNLSQGLGAAALDRGDTIAEAVKNPLQRCGVRKHRKSDNMGISAKWSKP